MQFKKRWYRKFLLDVDKAAVEETVARYTDDPAKYAVSTLAGPYLPEDSSDLDGRDLVFRGEGHVLRFAFGGGHALRFTEDEGPGKDCYCNVKTMDGEVYLVNHLVPGYTASRQITLIADMRSGCATVCDAHIGTENSNVDVGREFIFGRLDGDFAGGPLHEFTNELVGKAFVWDYGHVSIKHMYTSNLYYTYSHPGGDRGAWMATNPADYIKVRDGLYIFSFVEERQHGLQGLFLIDVNTCHDIGSFYGVRPDHVSSSCVGAKGTPADILTIF